MLYKAEMFFLNKSYISPLSIHKILATRATVTVSLLITDSDVPRLFNPVFSTTVNNEHVVQTIFLGKARSWSAPSSRFTQVVVNQP